MKKNGVVILNKSGLRSGQKSLYRLLVEKIKSGDAVTYKEAEDIWLNDVANIENGVPMHWDYSIAVRDDNGNFKGWTSRKIAYTEEYKRFTVVNWLVRNIGLLVIKGYLKVIPMVELAALEAGTPAIQEMEGRDDTHFS